MSDQPGSTTVQILTFGPFRLDTERGILYEGNKPVRLGNRALEILLALVERAGEVVSNQELIARVWPETFVEESNLRVHLGSIRKALRDGQDQIRYILNVPGRGYRFVEPVTGPRTEQTDGIRKSTLPAMLTELVGRAETIADIVEDLAGHRLVTIAGAGGIGKTSVALAVAHAVSDRYEYGACFVDLAALTDPGLVSDAVAGAVGVPLLAGRDAVTLYGFLREKSVLIVLDNCEHVIQAAAELAENILKRAHEVRILTTSREPLRAEGEWLRRLPPLEAPPETAWPITASDAAAFPAVQLFIARARAVADGFELKDDEAPVVTSLCRRLDGIPLAIELAAARLDSFGIDGLSAQLDDSLSLLTRGRRTAQDRHRTLRATLDWSFRLLSESEQTILARLGVFRTMFSCEAAVAVASDGRLGSEAVLDGVTSLAAKSLVATSFSAGRVAWRLLETTRAYALSKLRESAAAASIHRRHAEYFRTVARRLEVQSVGNESRRIENRQPVIDELRSALEWAFSEAGDATLGLELAASSSAVWYRHSLLDEFRAHAERALEHMRVAGNPATESVVRLLGAVGSAIYNTRGLLPAMRDTFASALRAAEEINHIDGQLWAIFGLWQYHHGIGDYEQSLALTEEYARRSGATHDVRLLLPRIKGITHVYRGELTLARECADLALRSRDRMTESGRGPYDYDPVVVAQVVRARVLWLQGFPEQAMEQARACVAEGVATKHSLSMCFAAALAGCPIALWSGDVTAARDYLRLLEESAAAHGLKHWHGYSQVFARALGVRKNIATSAANANYRHREESSVLGEDFASEEVVTRSLSDRPIWCSAEVLRLEAMKAESRVLLLRSLEIARSQGALAWELRTATSLALLGDRNDHALDLLQSVVDRFTEGFETPDFVRALTALRELRSAFGSAAAGS